MRTYLQRTLALWQADDDGVAADQVFSSTGAFIAIGAVLGLVTVFAAVTFGELGGAWLSGNWHSYWSIANSPLHIYWFYWLFPFISQFSSRAKTQAGQPSRAGRIRELRQAALDGDETRAPLAREQPIAFAAGELSASGEIVPRLRPLVSASTNWRRRAAIYALTLAALIGGGLGILLFCMWSDMAMADGQGDPYGALLTVCLAIGIPIWIASVAFLLTGGIVLLRRAPRVPRAKRMRIDPAVSPWEVHWISPTRPPEVEQIAWEDVRAFYHISYRSVIDYALHTTYFLDTGTTLLAWETSSSAAPELLETNERFLRIIVTYTSLPLRDLSSAAQELSNAVWAPKVTTQAERSAALQAARETRRAAREARRSRPRRRMRSTGYMLLAGIAALLALLLAPYVAGWRLQGMQQGYYNAIAARTLAHHQLFSDPLLTTDARWLVQWPDGGKDPSYTYQDGGYQIGGGPANNTAYATLSTPGGDNPVTYGDAAVEVTVRQTGTSVNDGAGLVLRDVETASNSYFVAFWVEPNGDWYLERFSGNGSDSNGWSFLASSDNYSGSSPVNAEPDASNIILVVMRGDEIICFVNGEFVTAARDSNIPASGRVGVYVNDTAGTGTFSDFKVYPAA